MHPPQPQIADADPSSNHIRLTNEKPPATASAAPSTVKGFVTHWFIPLGSGISLDIRARAPFYLSDWTDAWNYRVIPATTLIFFAK